MKLEYKIMGSGKDIVVFENGLGNSMYGWEFVQRELKNEYRMLTYHRAGYGKSQIPETERTTASIIEELNELLDELDIKENIILVGHSFGGLCAQHFARKYGYKLKGLVLVDSTSVNFQRLTDERVPFFNENMSNDGFAKQWREIGMKSDKEFQEIMKHTLNEKEKELSQQSQEGIVTFMSKAGIITAADEMDNFLKSAQAMKKCHDMPDVPTIVLARDVVYSANAYLKYDIPEKEARIFEEIWRELQMEISEVSPRSSFVSAEGCDHSIHIDNPDYVVKAIRGISAY